MHTFNPLFTVVLSGRIVCSSMYTINFPRIITTNTGSFAEVEA